MIKFQISIGHCEMVRLVLCHTKAAVLLVGNFYDYQSWDLDFFSLGFLFCACPHPCACTYQFGLAAGAVYNGG